MRKAIGGVSSGGARTFEAIPDSLKDEVRALARVDVEVGALDRETYQALIGEVYEGKPA